MEIEEIPFAGAGCDEKERKCKLWWLTTRNNKTYTVEIEVPIDIIKNKSISEVDLEEMFSNSKAKIE